MIQPLDNFYIRHGATIGFSVVTVMMILLAGMFYRQGIMVDHAKIWVVHTYEVTRRIQVLSNKFKDAELGQRGYILTGDYRYLDPYNDAIRESTDLDFPTDPLVQHHSLTQEAAVLRRLTADNMNQKKNLDELDIVAKDLLAYWDSTIEMRRNGKTEGLHKNGHMYGKKMMDRVRKIISAMISEENRLLSIRTRNDEIATFWNNILTYSGLSLFYIGMMVSIWLVNRHWNRARRAESEVYSKAQEIYEANRELQATNEQLTEFTQELQSSEEELKSQQEELETSNEEMQEKNRILENQNEQIRNQARELGEHKQAIEDKVQELALSSRYKSEFLANMSHELRTPLNSLLILSRSLAGNEEGNLTAEQVEEARVIYNGGLELLNLINDILDLSKYEAGKINIVSEETPISGVLKRMEQQFDPVAKEKGVKFYIRKSEFFSASIDTDVQRLEQILKNLLSNAFKFTERGSVTLEIFQTGDGMNPQRSSLKNRDVIAFSVADTGIGIEESKLKDIFEAFQQEDGSIDRHYGGTGLGLTIARKFAHLLGGEIHVSSKKGKGSIFTLLLPMLFPQESELKRSSESRYLGEENKELNIMPRVTIKEFISDDRNSINDNDKSILIIEDDRNFAQTLIKISQKRGYKCLVAGDGKAGVLMASEYNVSAIILDLNLPDMDGINVLDQLKHNLKTRHIPVHIITGREKIDNISSLQKGAIGYLVKPVSAEDIDSVFLKIEEILFTKIKKILVIEDDKKSQMAICSLLNKKDMDIICVDTGTEAISRIENEKFDCIVLDLLLPDMTGFDLLEKIESTARETESVPVIVYTAKDLSEEENRKINQYTGNIIIKGATSSERLLDEVTLFLHSVESTLTESQKSMIRMHHDPDRALHGRKVLLVDDDLRNTFALSKILKKHGMNVSIADNGSMAIEKLKEEKDIELIIMDIMMPVMDGYQAMAEIKRKNEFNSIPIIALTARAMPEEQQKCIESGANDYMTKPVDVDRLITLLRVWLFRQDKAA